MVRNGLGREADFSYWQCYEALDGPIAQLDRVTDFYSVGCRFESCWDRQLFQGLSRYLDPQNMSRLLRKIPKHFQWLPRTPGKSAQHEARHERGNDECWAESLRTGTACEGS